MRELAKGYSLLFCGIILLVILALVQIAQAVFAQTVDPMRPETWFVSIETVMIAGAVLAGWVVKLLTALGKQALVTSGERTRLLSAGISVLVAGGGGYLALGMFGGEPGLASAGRAALMALWAVVQANASAIYDRQLQDRLQSQSLGLLPGLGVLGGPITGIMTEFVAPLVKDLLGSRAEELSARAYALIEPITAEMEAHARTLGLERVSYQFARPYLGRISQTLRSAGLVEVSK